ncbi:MAG: hypothetical protein BAJALOKI1v1_1030005 [Promethearchaeota archaeon]|nr:MAG: hypothetical protein BAJALOKI1v1_1030005 [Candidatus Lokiarchaeota archaeon]
MTNENRKSVFIQCPTCLKNGKIEIPRDKIEKKASGLSLIIVKKLICEHVFLAYIDKNFTMRESEEVYFVPSPQIIEKSKKIKEEFFDKNELDLINLNLYPLTLNYILKSLMNAKAIGIVLEERQDFLKTIYEKFLNFLFNNTFNTQYQIILDQEYSEAKEELNLPIIVKNIEIIKDNENFLTDVEFAVERGFIQKFYNDEYGLETLRALKFEINNAFLLAQSTKEFIENTKKLNLNKVIKFLEKEFNINIDVKYAEFLIGIVKNYYNVEVGNLYKNVEFMKFKKLSK